MIAGDNSTPDNSMEHIKAWSKGGLNLCTRLCNSFKRQILPGQNLNFFHTTIFLILLQLRKLKLTKASKILLLLHAKGAAFVDILTETTLTISMSWVLAKNGINLLTFGER